MVDGTGAAHHEPSIGEALTLGGLPLRFLFVPADPAPLDNPNQLSLIFTVRGKEKKLLFTGDAYANTLQAVLEQFPQEIPCDVLQLPHHGLCDTGHAEFYRLANAQTVLVPISVAGDRTMATDMYGDAPAANRFAQSNARAVYKAFEGHTELVF